MTERGSGFAVLAAAPLWAHHSAAEYDASKLLLLTRKVTKVEWINPHVFFHLEVKDARGTATRDYSHRFRSTYKFRLFRPIARCRGR
jgi:hypothetical protein